MACMVHDEAYVSLLETNTAGRIAYAKNATRGAGAGTLLAAPALTCSRSYSPDMPEPALGLYAFMVGSFFLSVFLNTWT
jgi:hypothetical protein